MKLATRSRCFLVCVVSLLAQLLPLNASSGQQRLSPTEIVERYLSAKEAQRWSEAAKYLDLSVLAVKRDTALKYSAEPKRIRHWTPEDLIKYDSTMPRAVAEYQVRKMGETTRNPRFANPWSFEFADVVDASALRTMTPVQLGASWIRAHDERYMMSVMTKDIPGCDSAIVATIVAQQVAFKPTHKVLGSILLDSIAYVLNQETRWPTSTPRAVQLEWPPQVFTLRKVGGEWKIYPAQVSNGVAYGASCSVADDKDDGHL